MTDTAARAEERDGHTQERDGGADGVALSGPCAIARAFAMAASAHGFQKRKSSGETYLVHVAEVAELVTSAGAREGWGDEAHLLAAMLHDAVEDSDLTPADLEDAFGPRVAGIVAALTDEPEWDALDTREHKMRQAAAMRAAGAEARRIKIADQTSNCLHRARTLDDRDPAKVAAYLAGARGVIAQCRAASPWLEARFEAAADGLETALTAHLDAIEEGARAVRGTMNALKASAGAGIGAGRPSAGSRADDRSPTPKEPS